MSRAACTCWHRPFGSCAGSRSFAAYSNTPSAWIISKGYKPQSQHSVSRRRGRALVHALATSQDYNNLKGQTVLRAVDGTQVELLSLWQVGWPGGSNPQMSTMHPRHACLQVASVLLKAAFRACVLRRAAFTAVAENAIRISAVVKRVIVLLVSWDITTRHSRHPQHHSNDQCTCMLGPTPCTPFHNK